MPDVPGESALAALFGICRATIDGRMLDANDQLAGIYGFANAQEFIAAFNAEPARYCVDAARRDELLQTVAANGCARAFEYRIRRQDGYLAWISESAMGERDASGEIAFVQTVVEDITERRQLESHRHDSEEKLLTLISSVDDGLWSVDAEYRLITFNAPFIRMFVELTGHVLKAGDRVTDVIPEDWRQEEIVFYQRALAGERFVVEQRYLSFTGEKFYELSFNPIYGAEGVSGVAVLSKDSTERHRTQLELKLAKSAAEDASRLKSEFLANMSHEIRTPMNGILGMTDLLLRTGLGASQREFVNTIRISGDSLLTVINDILDFSKIEAGKLQFETIDFNLHDVVESTLDLFAAPALAKKLEIGAITKPDVPDALRGDPSRLRQVLNNLLSNAIKFTEIGEIVLTISQTWRDDSKVRLEFQLRDTGIGIDATGQARLFEAFSQADGSTTRKYGGTGLGLAISKRLVELMNGEISVHSIAGRGATFTFAAEFEAAAVEPQTEGLFAKRALVVSNNPTSRLLLGEYLSGWRVEILFAHDEASVLQVLESTVENGRALDLAIVDAPLETSTMNALFSSMREAQPKARLVAFTSTDRQLAEERLDAGIEVLAKPLKQSRLFEVLRSNLSHPIEKESFVIQAVDSSTQEPASHGLRILLAEDNTVNQKVALAILRNLGYAATIARNGEEALAALAKETYDLVFMDCQMPVIDGFEASRRIREMNITQPRIIAMTANALPGDKERCLAAGMDDYVTKPIRPEILREKLSDLETVLRNSAQ